MFRFQALCLSQHPSYSLFVETRMEAHEVSGLPVMISGSHSITFGLIHQRESVKSINLVWVSFEELLADFLCLVKLAGSDPAAKSQFHGDTWIVPPFLVFICGRFRGASWSLYRDSAGDEFCLLSCLKEWGYVPDA
ncbi:MAG: hypothetical protein V1792_26450 [Pseudomonadota bacterium]